MNAVAGNIASQKYEVSKNIQRHLHVITATPASEETTRWRNFTPNYSISNFATDKTVLKTKQLNVVNEALAERLFRITQEDRRGSSAPVQPGWRKGSDAVFIDCYEDVHYHEVKQRFENNNQHSRQIRHDRRNKQNVSVHKYIAMQKSSYENSRLRKEYEENRRLYRIFEKKPPNTTLHLGLVSAAKKELRKKAKTHSINVQKEREHVSRQKRSEGKEKQVQQTDVAARRQPTTNTSPSRLTKERQKRSPLVRFEKSRDSIASSPPPAQAMRGPQNSNISIAEKRPTSAPAERSRGSAATERKPRDFDLFSSLPAETALALRAAIKSSPVHNFDALASQMHQPVALSPDQTVLRRPFSAAAYGTVESFLGVENGLQFLEESGYRDIAESRNRNEGSSHGASQQRKAGNWTKFSQMRKNVTFDGVDTPDESDPHSPNEFHANDTKLQSQQALSPKKVKDSHMKQQIPPRDAAINDLKVRIDGKPPKHPKSVEDATSPATGNYTQLGYHSAPAELLEQLSGSDLSGSQQQDGTSIEKQLTDVQQPAEEILASSDQKNDKMHGHHRHHHKHHHSHHHGHHHGQHHHKHAEIPQTPHEIEQQKLEYLEQYAREEREELERSTKQRLVLKPIDGPSSRENENLLFAVRRSSFSSTPFSPRNVRFSGAADKETPHTDRQSDECSTSSTGSGSSSSSSSNNSTCTNDGAWRQRIRFCSAAAIPSAFIACSLASRSGLTVRTTPVAVINSARVNLIGYDGSCRILEPDCVLQQQSMDELQKVTLVLSDINYDLPCSTSAVMFTDDFSKVHAKEISERRRAQMRRASARVLSRGRLPGLEALLEGNGEVVLPLNSTNEQQVQPAPASYGVAVQVVHQIANAGGSGIAAKKQQRSAPSENNSCSTCMAISVDQLEMLAEQHGNEDVQRMLWEMKSFSYEFGDMARVAAQPPPTPLRSVTAAVSNKNLHLPQLDEDAELDNSVVVTHSNTQRVGQCGAVELEDDSDSITIYPQLSSMLDSSNRPSLCSLILDSVEVVYDRRTQDIRLRLRDGDS